MAELPLALAGKSASRFGSTRSLASGWESLAGGGSF
jgi:hypothetical protein